MPAKTIPGEKPRKFLPPFWMVLCVALAWLLDRYAPLWSPELPLLGFLGRGIALLGLAMILWPVMQFLLAHTGLVPFSKATTLVTTGLYRLTRNPMYLGMVLILLGAALVFGSLGALLPLPLFVIIIQRRFILGEERFLEATFGNEYRAYRQRVRRWI
jgi:protein-S-isoprenylcysteine O-methyltransferase Ste14